MSVAADRSEIVHRSLASWGWEGAPVALAAERENVIYRIEAPDGAFALRLHRPGYHGLAALRSELQWMAALAAGGLAVPSPRLSLNGHLIEAIGGVHVSALTWLTGTPMGRSGALLSLADRIGTFRALGATMAKLHTISDAWTPPPDFTRHAWDVEGLFGEAPRWGRFWESPLLDADQARVLAAARAKVRQELERQAPALDYGLIHSDTVRENILVPDEPGAALGLIDFDDGGFGFRAYDLAVVLLKSRAEPDYEALQTALLAGYRRHRPFPPEAEAALPLFMMTRALAEVGWVSDRLGEPSAPARAERMLRQAMAEVAAVLGLRV